MRFRLMCVYHFFAVVSFYACRMLVYCLFYVATRFRVRFSLVLLYVFSHSCRYTSTSYIVELKCELRGPNIESNLFYYICPVDCYCVHFFLILSLSVSFQLSLLNEWLNWFHWKCRWCLARSHFKFDVSHLCHKLLTSLFVYAYMLSSTTNKPNEIFQ